MNADLEAAARAGDIEKLYRLIEDDPRVLKTIDEIPFVDTPLHIAASEGQIRFSTEIIRLMPSFAVKLNKQGRSPMHLALRNGHDSMVHRFVSINKELVRVKGRQGLTPLHSVAKTGRIEILAKFLLACPASIEDLTVEGETALHIAVKKGQFQALQVLVGWLWRSSYQLRQSILNWENESKETILHVSTRLKDAQTVKLLIKSRIKVNAKNWNGLTALDIVEMPEYGSAEIMIMLLNAKAKRGTVVTDAPSPTLAKRLMSDLTIAETFGSRLITTAPKLDEKTTNVIMAVAGLVATMAYQSALSPPGGVYQADASAASSNSNNSTLLVGRSVMSTDVFALFWSVNSICLFVSTGAVCSLLPTGLFISIALMTPIIYFWVAYGTAMKVISPSVFFSEASSYSLMAIGFILFFGFQASKSIVTWFELTMSRYKEKETELGGNRW